MSFVHVGSDANVLEFWVEKGWSSFSGGEAVINEKPLDYLFTTLSTEFCYFTYFSFDYCVIFDSLG